MTEGFRDIKSDPALLDRLVERARNYRMTPEERHRQRVSFIAGQTGFDHAYIERVLSSGWADCLPKRLDLPS